MRRSRPALSVEGKFFLSNELSLFGRMIDTKSRHAIPPEHFIQYPEVYEFFNAYEKQFGKLPNRATVVEQCGVELPETNIDLQWLADEVREAYVASVGKTIAYTLMDSLNKEDANPSVIVAEQIAQMQKLNSHLGNNNDEGIDLLSSRERMIEEMLRRLEAKESGITLGMKLLDEAAIGGTKPGELEVYIGRPGDGKTLFLLHSSYHAAKTGHHVAFFSPEMDEHELRSRLDTMHYHFSNRSLVGLPTREFIDFYADETAQREPIAGTIRLHRPNGGRITTTDIARVIERDKPDIVVIDGLLFVAPMQQTKDIRTRMVAVIEELKMIVDTTRCPIRAAHQANRQAEVGGRRAREATYFSRLPELHHAAESGAVEQFSNRVIAVKHMEGRTYFAVIKNRNGPKGLFCSFQNDIDTGTIRDERTHDINEIAGVHPDDEPEQGRLDRTANF